MAWHLTTGELSWWRQCLWHLFTVPLNEAHVDIYWGKDLIKEPDRNKHYCSCLVLECVGCIALEKCKANTWSAGIKGTPPNPAADRQLTFNLKMPQIVKYKFCAEKRFSLSLFFFFMENKVIVGAETDVSRLHPHSRGGDSSKIIKTLGRIITQAAQV